ncbi:unnamed protein product, partial [Prorocentrum cordatum]
TPRAGGAAGPPRAGRPRRQCAGVAARGLDSLRGRRRGPVLHMECWTARPAAPAGLPCPAAPGRRSACRPGCARSAAHRPRRLQQPGRALLACGSGARYLLPDHAWRRGGVGTARRRLARRPLRADTPSVVLAAGSASGRPPFDVVETPDRGKVAVANRPLAAGAVVLDEAPLLLLRLTGDAARDAGGS